MLGVLLVIESYLNRTELVTKTKEGISNIKKTFLPYIKFNKLHRSSMLGVLLVIEGYLKKIGTCYEKEGSYRIEFIIILRVVPTNPV